MAQNSLTQKYKKWDNFDDSDEEREKIIARKPTTYELGHEKVEIQDVNHLAPELKEKLRRLPQTKNEIWQVVVRKLRVWSAASFGAPEGPDAVPVRPFCIFVNNLYPMGQVLTRHVCDPPETSPDEKQVLHQIIRAMEKPPEGIPQHRPDKVVFPDPVYVGALSKSLAAIGIEVSKLSESAGIDEHVRQFSEYLVKKDIAASSEIGERPGLMVPSDRNVHVVKALYSTAARYRQREPWKQLLERQGIEMEVIDEMQIGRPGEQQTVIPAGRYFLSVLGAGGGGKGLGLFFCQADLEHRVLPGDIKNARLEDPLLQRCNFTRKSMQETKEKLKRCTRCKSVFYVDQEAQRQDWPTHKKFCQQYLSLGPGQTFWSKRELSLIFETVTMIPFDDHELIDRLNLDLADDADHKADKYPLPLAFSKGAPERPNLQEIVLLELGMQAVLGMLENAPTYMKESIVYPCGLPYQPLKLQIHTDAANVSGASGVKVALRNATVVSVEELARFRKLVTQSKEGDKMEDEERPTSKVEEKGEDSQRSPRLGQDNSPPRDSDSSEPSIEKETPSGGDEGRSCSVM